MSAFSVIYQPDISLLLCHFLRNQILGFFGQPNSRQTLKSNNSPRADWINIPAVASSRCVWCQHQSDLSWFQLLHGGSVFVIGSLSRLYLVCLSADEYECHSVQTHWRRLFRADWLVARFEIIHLAVFLKKNICQTVYVSRGARLDRLKFNTF